MNIQDLVYESIRTDGDYKDHYDDEIIRIYKTITKEEKEIIDGVLMRITGYTLKTLIKKHEKIQADKITSKAS